MAGTEHHYGIIIRQGGRACMSPDESPWLQFTSECQRFCPHRAPISR
eukprot:COSAG01_NODE_12495_length_1729_cov_1.871166_1_plen_46_part_10